MKHRVKHNQLGRNTNQAKALYRGLVQSLFAVGRVETTVAKAKAVVGDVDHAITIAKRNDVNSRRLLIKMFGNDFIMDQIFVRVKSMAGRNSGYTRIIRLENRGSDNAQMAILELVDQTSVPATVTAQSNDNALPESQKSVQESEKTEAVESTSKVKKPATKKAVAKKETVKKSNK